MSKKIFIIDKEYSFQEITHLLVRAILSISAENDESVFSMTDLLCLLRSINEFVPGEFELQRTHSQY